MKRRAHSKSEYKRLKVMGAQVEPPLRRCEHDWRDGHNIAPKCRRCETGGSVVATDELQKLVDEREALFWQLESMKQFHNRIRNWTRRMQKADAQQHGIMTSPEFNAGYIEAMSDCEDEIGLITDYIPE